MFHILRNSTLTMAEASAATSSETVDLAGGAGFSIIGTVTVSTPTAKTFDSGTAAVTTLTFATKAATAAGDYIVIYDTAGLAWAVAANKTGSDPAPTGAIWTAIPAGRKAQCDISAASTAAQVAAAFELSFDALTAVPFATDDSAADGTMLITMTLNGVVTEASPHNTGDTGAGSIGEVLSTPGVASEVDVDANTVTIPTHGYTTGLKGQLTTTGTLPTGLLTGTDYFIIAVDADTVKFATSLSNAQAGTAINITSQGVSASVNTFTATSLAGASIKLQKSNDGTVWVDVPSSSQNVTTTAVFAWEVVDPMYRYVKALSALTAGQLAPAFLICIKT